MLMVGLGIRDCVCQRQGRPEGGEAGRRSLAGGDDLMNACRCSYCLLLSTICFLVHVTNAPHPPAPHWVDAHACLVWICQVGVACGGCGARLSWLCLRSKHNTQLGELRTAVEASIETPAHTQTQHSPPTPRPPPCPPQGAQAWGGGRGLWRGPWRWRWVRPPRASL